MDVTEFDVPLFSPNIAEINFDIFSLWLEGNNEKDVIQYLMKNVLHLKKDKGEEDVKFHMRQVVEQVSNRKLHIRKSGINSEEKDEKVDKGVYEKKDGVLVKTEVKKEVKKENTTQGNNKNKVNYFEKFASDNYLTKEKRNAVKARLRMKKKCSDLTYTSENSLYSSSSTNVFYYFLLLYIKHQFYIYNIISHHLGILDLRFSHLIVPLNKNVKLKLVKIYYNIDIRFEKEIIKYKNINNITKNVHTLIRVTNIHEVSIRRQIENIKNLWKYILNIYESKHINISKLYKHKAISFKRIVKSIKTRFHLYKNFIKRENVLEASDIAGGSQSSMQTKQKKKKSKKKKKKRSCANDSDMITTENNIIKLLEKLIGMSLAKRYFRLYWIIVYHIETPKKLSVPYLYFNKIILLLLEKLQINDLILSKEYTNMSKKIYAILNSAECMEKLKNDLFSITENDSVIRNRRFIRVKLIMNLLCCFRNTYEIKKLFLIFIDMHKSEPFENEQEFIKKHIGNSRLVNRVLSFIKEAENYTKKSGILNLEVYGSAKNL